MTAFYALCRGADDAIDLGDDPMAALERLHRRVDAIYAGTLADDPVDRALTEVVHGHAIPRPLLDTLLEGFAWDLEAVRYERLEQTLAYSARVASVVGVIMTLIMGPRDRPTLARACELGAAMQLTNIARDVGEDARKGRLYLPGQWLRDEGVDPEAFVGDPRPSPGVGRAVARLLAHADTLYASARAGIAGLPVGCRPAIRAASYIYADIGRVIAANDHDSVTRRATTSGWRKLRRLLQAWWEPTIVDRSAWHGPVRPELSFLVDAVVGRPRPATPLAEAAS